MTDHPEPHADTDDRTSVALAAMLSRPDVWDEPDAELEGSVVDAIGRAAAADRPVTTLDAHRVRRSLVSTAGPWVAAAAVFGLIVAGIVVASRGTGDDTGVVFALAGTDAQPDASATAAVSATPAGMKILLTPDGLPGAPVGFMYEAWVSDGSIRVSAGTFHLRGGGGTIELWAGVADSSFRRLSVTLEPIDGDEASSLDARLIGEFQLDD